MYNRIRIIYIICLAMIVHTSFVIIESTISMSLIVGLDVFSSIIYSFKTTYSYAIFITILIFIVTRCRKKYVSDNSDLTIKSNLFFVGVSLLILNGVSILQLPVSVISIFSSFSSMPMKYLMYTIVAIVFLIMEVGLGIMMIKKDHSLRQKKVSQEELNKS